MPFADDIAPAISDAVCAGGRARVRRRGRPWPRRCRRGRWRARAASLAASGPPSSAWRRSSPPRSRRRRFSASRHRARRMQRRQRQDVLLRRGQQLGRRAVVQHLEARRDIGLEREEMQQPLAEGVDGLDLQPARRLDGAGEEPPRGARAVAAEGCCALDASRWRRRARRRPASPIRRGSRTPGSPCWRRPPW